MSLVKRTERSPALSWDIEDLKTALMTLNENEEIRHMEQIFREERRALLKIDKLGQYQDVCEILEEELVDLRKEKLGDDLASFEKASQELKQGLMFRFLEGVSDSYKGISVPEWLTE